MKVRTKKKARKQKVQKKPRTIEIHIYVHTVPSYSTPAPTPQPFTNPITNPPYWVTC